MYKAHVKSFDFAINSAFSKTFCIKSHDLIAVGCYLAANLWMIACRLGEEKLLVKYIKSNNVICRMYVNNITDECAKLLRQYSYVYLC